MPGTDPREAATIVVGELPVLTALPELPARGVGADMIGRTAGLLVDIAVEVVPSGYRVTARPGRDQRRAIDLLRADLDAFDEAVDAARPPVGEGAGDAARGRSRRRSSCTPATPCSPTAARSARSPPA